MSQYGKEVKKKMDTYMTNEDSIDKEVSDIQNAMKGVEVRGALAAGVKKSFDKSKDAEEKSEQAHDVMESIINDGFDNAALESNFEQKLDDKINNLQPEWTQFKDQTNQQFAQTEEEINQTKTDLTRKRDKSTFINLNDMDEETLSAIAGGEGTEFTIESVPRNFSVSPEKTTFARKGKNLFDGAYVQNMAITGSAANDTGKWERRVGAISAVIKVVPGNTYTISWSSDTNRFGVGTSRGYPTENEYVRIVNMFDVMKSEFTVDLLENEDHILVYLSSVDEGLEPTWLQIEEGDFKTEYESPYLTKIELAKDSFSGSALRDNSLPAEKTTFIDVHPGNLFNGEYYAWIANRGLDHYSMPPNDGLKKSAIVEIVGGNSYAINTIEVPSRLVISMFDENPFGNHGLLPLYFQDFTGSEQSSVVVEAPEGATHLLAHVAEFDDVPEYMAITQTSSPQKPYILNTKIIQVDNSNSQPINEQPGRIHKKDIGYITDNVSDNYTKTDAPDYESSDIRSGDPLENTYVLWDELVDIAPEYVTKTHMWDEPVEGLPVYKYTFEPPKPLGPDAVGLNTIKMLVLGNIHGHETYATLTLINFFSDLVKKWKSDDTLQLFRWNVQFDVFPAYSSYGLKHNSRVNGNGVDLNSNLAYNWAIRDELGSMYYSGPYAMSEYENQQFDLYLDNLSYLYDFALDMHHNGVYAGKHVTYTRSMNSDINRILFGVANQMNGFLHKEYSGIFEGVEHGVMMADHLGTGRMFQFFEYKKVPGTILEIMHPGGALNPEDAVKISQTTVGNIFLSVIRNINDIKIIS